MPDAHAPFPFRHRCLRSGNCCSRPGGQVRVTPDDARHIADHLGMTEAAFRSRYVDVRGDRLAAGPTSACVFLEGGRPSRCTIYPVRPERCRSWPYWEELRDPTERAAAFRVCPGLEALDAAERDTGD
ncbi:MAG: YkgJ family cysteine cluster protein [Myxococcota bacterium]